MLLYTSCSDTEVPMTEARPLALTQAEMVVLFDWLAHSSDRGFPITDLHEAERRVLWDLEATLEAAFRSPQRPVRRPAERGAAGRAGSASGR